MEARVAALEKRCGPINPVLKPSGLIDTVNRKIAEMGSSVEDCHNDYHNLASNHMTLIDSVSKGQIQKLTKVQALTRLETVKSELKSVL